MRFGNSGAGPLEDPDSGRPLDLSALRADDALLDALGAGLVRPDQPYEHGAESDRELVTMLAAWAAQVRSAEEESLPDLGPNPVPASAGGEAPQLAAVPALQARPTAPIPSGRAVERRRWVVAHFSRRVAAAALLAGLASSSLALGISDAGPDAGSSSISRVAYAERARSIAAAAQVSDELEIARTALRRGHRAEAARVIAAIRDQLPAVRPDDGRALLDRDHRRLQDVLAASGGPPAAGDLVLAANAPEVEPSDFIGNLADENDILVGGAGATGGGNPAPPSDVILAEAPRPNGTRPSAGISAGPADGGQAGSGSTATSDEDGSEAAPSASSDAQAAAEQPTTDEQPTTTDDQSATTDEQSAITDERPTSDEQSSSDQPSSSSEQTPTEETTPDQPSSVSAPSEPADEQADPPSSAPGTPDEPSSTAGQEPDRSGTSANRAAAGGSASAAGRSTATSPRSRDFIGPVAEPTTSVRPRSPSATDRPPTEIEATSVGSASSTTAGADDDSDDDG